MIRATPFILGAFFTLATLIVLCAGIALAWPGTFVDAIWNLAPARHAELIPHRGWLGPFFLSLSIVFATAAIGTLGRKKWGLHLAVAIFIVNGIGDLVQVFIGHATEGIIGVIAASIIFYWLTRAAVDDQFARTRL